MTIRTDQCSICLASPPYDQCLGLDCARLVHCGREREAAEAYATAAQNKLLALIEFTRNHAADKCQSVAVTHFTDREQWLNDGDVDSLEIAAARGADDGATECRNAVQAMDCHAILKQWIGNAATKG